MRRPQPGPGECRHCFRVHDSDEMCWPAEAASRRYGDPESDDWSGTTDRLESFVLDITNPHQDTRRGAHGFQVEEAKRVAAWLRGGLADGTLTVDDLIPAAAVPVVPEEPSEDTTPAPPDTDEPVCTCERAKLGGHPRTSTHATDCPWTAYRAATPAPVADVEPQPAPVRALTDAERPAASMATALAKAGVPTTVSASDNGLLIRVHNRHSGRLLDLLAHTCPVDVLAMPEWAALVQAVNDDSGTVANYRANVTGKASSLVRAARSAAGSES